MQKLAKEDDAAEVVGVVGGERDELVVHGHDAGGSTATRRAADGMVEAGGVLCGRGGLVGAVEEAMAQLYP